MKSNQIQRWQRRCVDRFLKNWATRGEHSRLSKRKLFSFYSQLERRKLYEFDRYTQVWMKWKTFPGIDRCRSRLELFHSLRSSDDLSSIFCLTSILMHRSIICRCLWWTFWKFVTIRILIMKLTVPVVTFAIGSSNISSNSTAKQLSKSLKFSNLSRSAKLLQSFPRRKKRWRVLEIVCRSCPLNWRWKSEIASNETVTVGRKKSLLR